MREAGRWSDVLAAMLALPDSTPCTLTIGAGPYTLGDLKAKASQDGPATLTTVQAAERYGWSAGYWRDVAKAAGVAKDRMWRLPVAVCEAHMAQRQGRKRKRKPWGG